jgi:hypothetical protein
MTTPFKQSSRSGKATEKTTPPRPATHAEVGPTNPTFFIVREQEGELAEN